MTYAGLTTADKDVLLERWRDDTEKMAKAGVRYDWDKDEYFADHDGKTVYYDTYDVAVNGEIAYLNSPAEERP